MAEIEKGSASRGADKQPRTPEQPTMATRGIYYHPVTQVSMLGFLCFMCPGLFSALGGLGGGEQISPTTSVNVLPALYATSAVAALFSGSIHNKLGSRLTLLLGSTGYSLCIGSYLVANIHPNAGGFVIFAGVILEICAGLLWAAQGSLMLAYPTEGQKGRFIGIFLAIFNLGGAVEASVSLGQNFHSKIGFLVPTLIGVTIPLFMVDPKKMIRTDGTKVTILQGPSWMTALYGLWVALRTDPMIMLLFPMFFAFNWFVTWQSSVDAIFNIRASSLNNLVYCIAQITGSIATGFLLDYHNIRRRARAFSGWAALLGMVFIIHIWGYFYQRQYFREPISPDGPGMDIHDPGYVGWIWLYVFCGSLDAMWQTTLYWIIGAMSNDPAKLTHFAAFYKAIQSVSAASAWRANAVGLSPMNAFLSSWILLAAGLIFALPMLYLRVKNHTDETLTRMGNTGKVRSPEEAK